MTATATATATTTTTTTPIRDASYWRNRRAIEKANNEIAWAAHRAKIAEKDAAEKAEKAAQAIIKEQERLAELAANPRATEDEVVAWVQTYLSAMNSCGLNGKFWANYGKIRIYFDSFAYAQLNDVSDLTLSEIRRKSFLLFNVYLKDGAAKFSKSTALFESIGSKADEAIEAITY